MRQTISWTATVLALLVAAGCSSGGDDGTSIQNGTGGDGTGSDTVTGSDSVTSGNTDPSSSTDETNNGTGSNTLVDTDTEECAAQPNKIEINPINMLVLLDRSDSMRIYQVQNDTDTSDSYASVVATALKQVVASYDATDLINFGLAVFPSMDCEAGDTDPSDDVQCKPASTENSPIVEIGPDNASEIEYQLDHVGTCGGTPISASLTWASAYIDSLSPELKQQDTYVLLATDGAPNCNKDNNKDVDVCDCTGDKTPQGNCPAKILCLDDSATYNAAVKLRQKGVKVFVIGVGGAVAEWENVMNNIANYGGTGSYYPASNPATLSAALETITGEAVECTFDVDWASVPKEDEHGNVVDKRCNKVRVFGVTTGGETQTINYSYDCSDGSGWRWQGLDKELDPNVKDTTPLDQCSVIELCPDTCKALKQATYSTITASFGCGVIPVQ